MLLCFTLSQFSVDKGVDVTAIMIIHLWFSAKPIALRPPRSSGFNSTFSDGEQLDGKSYLRSMLVQVQIL